MHRSPYFYASQTMFHLCHLSQASEAQKAVLAEILIQVWGSFLKLYF